MINKINRISRRYLGKYLCARMRMCVGEKIIYATPFTHGINKCIMTESSLQLQNNNYISSSSVISTLLLPTESRWLKEIINRIS